MNIGGSIALIVIGAILAFAVNASVSGIDIAVVGWILMIGGLIWLLVSLLVFAPRRRAGGAGTTYTEEHVRRDRDVY